MRLGLFGGSFDPVHYGHLLLAECCREQCTLDEVRFVPAAVPPHKPSRELTPGEQRAEMLELATAGHPAFAVSRFEIDRGGLSYTIDTLRHFHRETPEAKLFLLMGADMLNDLPTWCKAARVCELALPVAVRRAGSSEPDFDCLAAIASAERIEQIRHHQSEMPQVGISGTEIRRRAAQRRSIRFQTPRAVEEYIATRELYG